MDFHHVLVSHADDGVANGLQISLEFMLICLCELFLCHNDKFGTVTELDISRGLSGNFLLAGQGRSGTLGCERAVIDLLAKESIVGTLQDFHKSLSAGVHNTCLLQNRKHVRSLCKDCISLLKQGRDEHFQIIRGLSQFTRLLSDAPGNGEDRPLLWFHDSLVGCVLGTLAGCREVLYIDLLLIPQSLCKATQKLG